ncbi:MAG: SGNH/GDSL hydrolase family protein [Pyrinomonadaceae bacterium]
MVNRRIALSIYHLPFTIHPLMLRQLTQKLLLVLAGVVFGLLVVEIALRIAGFTFPVFYTTDEDRGYALKASMAGWYRIEGESYVRINSDGLRDVEHSKTKPPNTFRIAVIGDSYAEALQVPLENSFWMVMRKKLQECRAFNAQQIEVINFGVSGYGTAQELITLRKHVWQYSPDLILLAFTTNNDITDNSRPLKRTDEIPYFVFRDGQLALDDSFKSTPAFRLHNSALSRFGGWLRDNLRFVQAVGFIQRAIKTKLAERRARKAGINTNALPQAIMLTVANADRGATPSGDIGTDNMVYGEPRDGVWQEAWRVTEALILQMRDEVKSHGAKLLVVTLSNGIQVHPEPSARAAFMQRVGAEDLFYPDKRITALCEHEGIAVLTLAPSLQAYAEQHKVFLHGFGKEIGNGHWNELGHRVAGEMIAEKLCAGG